jgi:hypothetical protein
VKIRPGLGADSGAGSEHDGGVSSGPSHWTKEWGSSGLAYLTGLSGGPPDFSRANVLGRAERIAADAATLLAGRAGMLGLTRGGRVSAGGATRLLAARDGWCAITLSRPDDVAALPALLHADEVPADPWPTLQQWAATRLASEIAERAGLLDIPAAVLGEVAAASPRIRHLGSRASARGLTGLLVADLSSMWAGPLCGQLLARDGATVVKVESPRRADGTRAGSRAFFDWVNGEKLSYCVDFDHRRAARPPRGRRHRDRRLAARGAGPAPARSRRRRAAARPNLVADQRVWRTSDTTGVRR